jgi:hypothetical protein
LSFGAIIVLVVLAPGITASMTGIFNFAHGEFVLLVGYTVYLFHPYDVRAHPHLRGRRSPALRALSRAGVLLRPSARDGYLGWLPPPFNGLTQSRDLPLCNRTNNGAAGVKSTPLEANNAGSKPNGSRDAGQRRDRGSRGLAGAPRTISSGQPVSRSSGHPTCLLEKRRRFRANLARWRISLTEAALPRHITQLVFVEF